MKKKSIGTHEAWSYELRMPLWGHGYLGHSKPCSASSADTTVPKHKSPETPAPRRARARRDFMPVVSTPYFFETRDDKEGVTCKLTWTNILSNKMVKWLLEHRVRFHMLATLKLSASLYSTNPSTPGVKFNPQRKKNCIKICSKNSEYPKTKTPKLGPYMRWN